MDTFLTPLACFSQGAMVAARAHNALRAGSIPAPAILSADRNGWPAPVPLGLPHKSLPQSGFNCSSASGPWPARFFMGDRLGLARLLVCAGGVF